MGGGEVTAILNRSSSKGQGLPEVKFTLVSVPAFNNKTKTKRKRNKTASNSKRNMILTLCILIHRVTASSLELSAIVNYVSSGQLSNLN